MQRLDLIAHPLARVVRKDAASDALDAAVKIARLSALSTERHDARYRRVIGARFGGNSKLGTKESGAEFGNQLLHGIGAIAEALAKLAIAAPFVRCPMRVMPISA